MKRENFTPIFIILSLLLISIIFLTIFPPSLFKHIKYNSIGPEQVLQGNVGTDNGRKSSIILSKFSTIFNSFIGKKFLSNNKLRKIFQALLFFSSSSSIPNTVLNAFHITLFNLHTFEVDIINIFR